MTTKIQLESNTLSAQVRDYILSLIARQKLTVGMPVPSEMQLTQELGVSKGVVREAYRSLAALGILETKSGKVPRIKAFDSSVLQVIFSFATLTEQVSSSQILAARRWLEAGCVQMAALNGDEEDFAALKQEMSLIREEFSDTERFLEHDLNFHLLLSQASKNPLFSILLQALHTQLTHSMRAGLEAQRNNHEYERGIIALHQRVCDCVCNRDAEGAMKAMDEHFNLSSDALNNQSPL
ncbi:FadR/GntR family transcriptional regulator [Escherichia coli]|uniref:FadR family transcriptional regulator n=3 Tax=Escherichia coli TaxID=562 RepID=A0A8S7CW88_ECOLX|nr:FadR/GntR family transcriptional regulator [Escherichia coli]EEZ6488674.1 FadR family transcriptional regulator [Escherichia coli O156]EFA4033188.1 FadR family transcriptional regulator [Escherichia coli O108:H9]EFB2195237.1 FadR family transcriptional regulator [Escherichia coli]EFB2357047.1 FadR family transcriptional regulator [Escherichia coli]EFB6065893.1 FadR family transcriptional regulator [Escherichia coli]